LGAALTGVLILLSFPLYGFEWGLDHLIWAALVPLFFAARLSGFRRGFLLGSCTGVIVEGGGFLWVLLAIRRFTEMPWPLASLCFLALLLYLMLPWALLGAALGSLRKPWGAYWILPFWVGLEHYYPRLFPWHLGGALYGREWLLQSVDLLGASGLTALVVWVNLSIYSLAALPGAGRRLVPGAISALSVLGALAYGRARLLEVERFEQAAPRVQVALLQGALDPFERGRKAIHYYLEKTQAALKGRKADLVVWPEGADPCYFDLTPGEDPWGDHREKDSTTWLLRDAFPVPVITGGTGVRRDRSPPFSNLAAYLPPGKGPLFYEKNIRMPFGEVIPFLDLVPKDLLRRLGLHVGTIAAGTDNPVFHLGDRSFRNLICYEAIFPDYLRHAATGVDFLVNITEDIWYGRTAHIPQHVSVLVLRVVENRIPLVRCTNIGPSGVFDITGRFHHGEKIFAPETVFGELKAAKLSTLHEKGGYLFPLVMVLASGLRLAVFFEKTWRNRNVRVEKGKKVASQNVS
jgi:apolipoprotein N-acyltransferase